MKRLLWSGQILILLISLLAYSYHYHLRKAGIPLEGILSSLHGSYLDFKFKIRGERPAESKIVIVGVDDESLSKLGRWPWPRDAIAYLIEKIMASKPKALGFDMVFSESEPLAKPEILEVLKKKNLLSQVTAFDNDLLLQKTLKKYSDKIVLGWASENCPFYQNPSACTQMTSEAKDPVAPFIKTHEGIPPATLFSLANPLVNIPEFSHAVKTQGFLSAWPDNDGVIRRSYLSMSDRYFTYPSLSAAMSLQELSSIDINFGGSRYSFPEVSALQVMGEENEIAFIQKANGRTEQKLADRESILKDAYVLLGLTATAGYDMKSFPLGGEVPGIYGHAWTLENLLSKTDLQSESRIAFCFMIALILLSFLGVFWSGKRFSASSMVLGSIGLLAFVYFFDQWVFFAHAQHFLFQYFYAGFVSLVIWTGGLNYIEEEKEKRFVKGAFGKYLSPKVVESILENPGSLELGGKKAELSILFSDLRNFTGISEKLDPKTLTEVINRFFTRMTEIAVDRYDGTLDKFMGDAILLFWGAPIAQKNHAELACRAAIDMQKEAKILAVEIKKEFDVEVSSGVGLATGFVNVGNMGSKKNFNYTVLGDTVNLASRLEGATKTYGVEILAPRMTIDHILNQNEKPPLFRALDLLVVKGKKEPIEIVQLLEDPLSSEALASFESARKLYRELKFTDAKKAFEKAGALIQKEWGRVDKASSLYIERCSHFEHEPPEANWNGSYEMKTK